MCSDKALSIYSNLRKSLDECSAKFASQQDISYKGVLRVSTTHKALAKRMVLHQSNQVVHRITNTEVLPFI